MENHSELIQNLDLSCKENYQKIIDQLAYCMVVAATTFYTDNVDVINNTIDTESNSEIAFEQIEQSGVVLASDTQQLIQLIEMITNALSTVTGKSIDTILSEIENRIPYINYEDQLQSSILRAQNKLN